LFLLHLNKKILVFVLNINWFYFLNINKINEEKKNVEDKKRDISLFAGAKKLAVDGKSCSDIK
jgi:hypothetical protein